jgi:hypothetical protein
MSIKIYPLLLSASGHHNVRAKLAFFELAARASLFNGVAGDLQISKKCIDRSDFGRPIRGLGERPSEWLASTVKRRLH